VAQPKVTVTADPEYPEEDSGFSDVEVADFSDKKAVAFACGEVSALISLEYMSRLNLDQGTTSAEAYGQFLERQAFQLSVLYSADPVLMDGAEAIRTYISTAPRTEEGWAYDATSTDWFGAQEDFVTACEAAGSPLIVKSEQ
jgi:hypothetical protein